ncbi:MAG: D-alanyl-D-alanine carboxypeptidase [Proteobacteria bacterium]|nr:D-alanyl-D-alanine carboxypeptidase [Pseudomonadota bacterium]
MNVKTRPFVQLTIYRSPFCLFLLAGCLLLLFHPSVAVSAQLKDVLSLIGKKDALILEDDQGNTLLSVHADEKRIPASTLKIFTSLFALHYLGDTYRFPTEFYLDPENNLTVKGYGDPLLISESLQEIARALKTQTEFQHTVIQDIILDATWFKQPVLIPGVKASGYDPYNAPNGALCVNFNTVYFKKDKKTGHYITAEPQTPLLPFVHERIKASPFSHERIVLSAENNENTLYAGHLLKFFLEQEGIPCKGGIRPGTVDPAKDKLVYTYTSTVPITEIISKMLYFSNNFIANQLLISAGAKINGPPGTLEKGLESARKYARETLKIDDLSIVEGSGISRQNQISATSMMTLLNKFAPHYLLLKHQGCEYFKTGTLTGISTRVGFILLPDGKKYAFVIIMNTKGQSAEKVVRKIKDILCR